MAGKVRLGKVLLGLVWLVELRQASYGSPRYGAVWIGTVLCGQFWQGRQGTERAVRAGLGHAV